MTAAFALADATDAFPALADFATASALLTAETTLRAVRFAQQLGKLPVVLFTAGGIATPAERR